MPRYYATFHADFFLFVAAPMSPRRRAAGAPARMRWRLL